MFLTRFARPLILLLIGFSLLQGTALADPSAKALSLFQKALKEHNAKNFGASLKLYFDAHTEDPEILSLDDEGLLRSSSNWLDDQLAADDTDIHAHFQMAELNMLQGLDRMALGHYERVVELDANSPLAKLAAPLIQDLKAQIGSSQGSGTSATAASTGGSGGGSGSSSDAAQTAQLQREMDQLKNELAQAKAEVARMKSELQSTQSQQQDTSELDKLRKEFDAYRSEAEKWKTFRNLYFSDLQKQKTVQP